MTALALINKIVFLVLALQLVGSAKATLYAFLNSPTFQSPSFEQLGESARVGIVHFLVLDTYGRIFDSFEIEISDSSGDKIKVTKQGDVQLAFGTYRARGTVGLHHPIEKQIIVDSPRSLQVFAFSFLDPGLSTVLHSSIHGKVVDPPPGANLLWIKAISLRGEFIKVIQTQSDGAFVINAVPYGDYLFLVFQGGTLIRTQQFSFTVREEEAIISAKAKARAQ